MVKVWRELYGMQKIHTKSTGTDFKVWLHSLHRDFMIHEVKRGLRRAEDHVEFFDLAVFRDLCRPRPVDFGLPEPLSAYQEARSAVYPRMAKRYSHAAVYYAGADTGWFDLNASRERDATHRKFLEMYKARCAQVMSGTELAMPKYEVLEHKLEKPSPDVVKGHMDGLRKLWGNT